MGLLGYLNDEIARFRKSLAIREINGATINDIVTIFIFDIGKIAIPRVILGLWCLVARLEMDAELLHGTSITSLVDFRADGYRDPRSHRYGIGTEQRESSTTKPGEIAALRVSSMC